MTQVLVLLLALLIGVIAGLRAFTAPAVLSWAALLNWIDLGDGWLSWLDHPITVGLLSVLALIELVGDQLPNTPSRKANAPFAIRLVAGGFAGLVLGTAFGYPWGSLGAGVVGAVLGTMGGYQARSRLVAANRGRDLPIAVGEDLFAVGGGFLIAYLASLL